MQGDQAYALLPRGEAVPVRTTRRRKAAVIGTLSGRAAAPPICAPRP